MSIDFAKYWNNLPYPNRSNFDNADAYAQAFNAYQSHDADLLDSFKKDAFAYFGWDSNDFTNKLWDMAWDRGHSSGYSDVFNCMYDMDDIYQAAMKHFN